MSGEQDPEKTATGERPEPEFPMLSHGITSGPSRAWIPIAAVLALLLVAGIVVGVTLGSHRSNDGAEPDPTPTPTPPPSRVVLKKHGLVAAAPDMRDAVQAVMPPEMRSALGSPRIRQRRKALSYDFPYGETNWSYAWDLNGGDNFRLNRSAVTPSRDVYAIVSTFDTEKEAIQGFRAGEGAQGLIFGSTTCNITIEECHYYGSRPGMGDSSFDLQLSVDFIMYGDQGYHGQYEQDGVFVGARFRNVVVHVYWWGGDVAPGNYPGDIIDTGTALSYSAALAQGTSYMKAIMARL